MNHPPQQLQQKNTADINPGRSGIGSSTTLICPAACGGVLRDDRTDAFNRGSLPDEISILSDEISILTDICDHEKAHRNLFKVALDNSVIPFVSTAAA